MNILRRLAAGAIAALTAASVFAGTALLRASAETHYELVGYYGDLDGSMTVDFADVFLLEDFLLAGAEDGDVLWKYADLDGSASVNAKDLSLLKQLILSGGEPEGDYEERAVSETLIPAPILAVRPTMPSTGEARVLLIAVNFPDCKHDEAFTNDYIQEMCFGPENEQSPAYPVESISAYYTRSSYGRLHLTGETYSYTAKYACDAYAGHTDALYTEVLDGLDAQIDFTRYDVNENGVLDTVLMALPAGAVGRDVNEDGTQDWWPCSGSYNVWKKFDGIRPGNLCIGAWDLNDITGFNSTWIHELGHAMGLPDYYKYVNNDRDYYGLNGNAGWEMMDDAYCDMSSFSKLMYGWFTTDEVMVYTGGTQTFELQSLQHAPNCILVPRGDLNGYYSEYFLIEFNTHDVNNKYWFSAGNPYQPFWFGGVRILHCDAELWDGYWGIELKWNNYGQMYDDSNQKQRVLRLVKDNSDYFRNNAVINNSVSGFAWYDDNGGQTVDPGLTITVSEYVEGEGCKITISQN